MSALDAALKVLQDAGKPLHYREITKRVLANGLWQTAGKTPDATINARLAVDVKKNGSASAFRRAGRGVFALNTERTDTMPNPTDIVRTETRSLYLVRPKSGETLSFTDSAERILEAAGGQPMHYRDITSLALEHGMLDTAGKTPEATMYAQLLTECKRRRGRGEQPRFLILGKGMISLAKWQAKGLAFQVEEANRKARKDLLKAVKEMPPGDFEDLIGRLLAAIGFDEVEVTNRSKDGGIDVRGTLVVGDVIRTRLAVQVKRWKQNVQSPVIQQVRGSLGAHEQGLIITTSDFSKGAKDEAERADATPVGLMDGEQLVALLVENEIGVRRTPLQLIEIGETLNAGRSPTA
ncbi:MAG: HTH domain-containing protein [Kiritimatiellae bacterium]|nr:HTH domain-containing protein [Kiritimatiellia bacterium]